ncbi:hypothetical protein J6590_035475 [Homalodisca vitripennis]|nr:hypothetical protein J6590_035475 [Homalodisca vitripennis]
MAGPRRKGERGGERGREEGERRDGGWRVVEGKGRGMGRERIFGLGELMKLGSPMSLIDFFRLLLVGEVLDRQSPRLLTREDVVQ